MPHQVALLSPPYGGSSNSMRPLGLIALYSYLKREFAEKLDLQLFDYSDCPAEDYQQLDYDRIASRDIVGLTAYSTNFQIVRNWAGQIKSRNPNVRIVIGGPHATALPEHIAEHHSDLFDFVVRGEGERPMAALLRSMIASEQPPRTPGLIYKDAFGLVNVGTSDPLHDLNSLPTPLAPVRSPYQHDLVCFDRRERRFRRSVPIASSRGCPFSCTFCSISASGTKWRGVGSERLGEWIADVLADDPSIEHVNFMDADFLIDRKRVVSIGEMLSARHPHLTWSFSARVDDLARLGEGALALLTKQGLRAVEVGFESGSQEMLDRLGKRVKIQENYEIAEMLQRVDLDILIDFILFIPDETPEQLRESLAFLRRSGLSDYLPHDHYFTRLIQYPQTPLRTFYEGLFNTRFPMDVLPEPDDLFVHEATRRIYRYFVKDFQPHVARLRDAIERVDRAAECLRTQDPTLAQFLRIESVSLRHIPYLVLETIIDHHQQSSLYDAVPWLRNFHEHLTQLEALCARQPTTVPTH